MKRRHRRFGAFSMDALNKSANVKDMAVGALIGVAGIAGLKYALRKITVKDDKGLEVTLLSKLPGFLQKVTPTLGGVLAGVIAYMVEKKNPSKAFGHAVGAMLAAASYNVYAGFVAPYNTGTEKEPEMPFADWGLIANDSPFGLIANDAYPQIQGYGVNEEQLALNELSNIAATDESELVYPN